MLESWDLSDHSLFLKFITIQPSSSLRWHLVLIWSNIAIKGAFPFYSPSSNTSTGTQRVKVYSRGKTTCSVRSIPSSRPHTQALQAPALQWLPYHLCQHWVQPPSPTPLSWHIFFEWSLWLPLRDHTWWPRTFRWGHHAGYLLALPVWWFKCLDPFRQLLTRLNGGSSRVPPVTCVVSNGGMSFTLDVAKELLIPDVLFWTTSACGLMAYMHYHHLTQKGLVPLKGTPCHPNNNLTEFIG